MGQALSEIMERFAERVTSLLPYKPNEQQSKLIGALARFCDVGAPSDSVFILNGYAGTGKTSLTGALVKALRQDGREVVLMAPTGRAAKVFSLAADYPSSTIHRRIYRGTPGDIGGNGYFALARNESVDTVFIVDEASMIGADAEGEVGRSLLDDLVEYVFTGDNSRLILLGDTAQLPPVGAENSPALLAESYKRLGLRVSRAVLTATARQQRHSGILLNATRLRRTMLLPELPSPSLYVDGLNDVAVTDGNDVADVVGSLYAEDGPGETVVVTRSNRRAREFNLGIRSRILDCEEELVKGERLLIARNNYMWSSRVKELDFIANGDVAIVGAIHSTEEKYGYRFANVRLGLPDRDVDVECRIFLDTLTDDSASIGYEDMSRLAQAIIADTSAHPAGASYEQRLRRLRTNEYFNALQVKYAYAMTCHKAQGAQWRNVIIDLGGIAPEGQTLEFYRWLYTATTRATTRLFYLNPDEAMLK